MTPRMYPPALALMALALLGGGPPEALAQKRPAKGKSPEETRIYIVQPGDSCWSIALKVFGKGEQYRAIHRINDLGPLPHILKPGQELRLPGEGAGPEARLAWLRKKVEAKAPTMLDWLEARKDMGLWRLYKVSTGAGSSAGILFEDQSSLDMREKALLVIYGGAATRTSLGTRPNTVVLEQGSVRGGLAALDQRADLLLRTPAAEVKLRSRSAQVEVDSVKSALVSVYDGKAQVAARGKQVEVPKDYGTRVEMGKPPEPPRPLPARPRWSADSGDTVVVVPRGTPGSLEGRWEPVKGAARFRVELARDDKFRFPMVDAVVGAGVRRFSARDLKPGLYHARVAAIDAAGLEGSASAVTTMEVLELTSSRPLLPAGDGSHEVAGFVRLDLPSARAADIEVRLDNGPYAPGADPVRLSTAGMHQVYYRLKGKQAESLLKLRVLALRARLEVEGGPLAVKGDALPVRLSLTDERARPAALPEVALTAYPGGPLPLAMAVAGQYSGSLPAPGAYSTGSVALVAGWPGGELARAQVQVAEPSRPEPPPPSVAPPPPEFSWAPGPATLEGPRQAPTLPSRSARPHTGLGLSAFAAQREAPSGEQEVFLRMALRGDLALLSGKLGLDLDLPFLQLSAEEDSAGGSELGDLRLGLRYLIEATESVALTPSLRITAPSGGYPRDRSGTVLEPAVILEWRPLESLTLGSNQVLAADLAPDQDAGLYYGGSYYAVLSIWRLSLAAELDSVIGLLEPGDAEAPRAVGASGALRLHLGRLRLGALGGAGINEDGRRLMGRFSVGLSADVGFLWP